jgi:hypothetical protein
MDIYGFSTGLDIKIFLRANLCSYVFYINPNLSLAKI